MPYFASFPLSRRSHVKVSRWRRVRKCAANLSKVTVPLEFVPILSWTLKSARSTGLFVSLAWNVVRKLRWTAHRPLSYRFLFKTTGRRRPGTESSAIIRFLFASDILRLTFVVNKQLGCHQRPTPAANLMLAQFLLTVTDVISGVSQTFFAEYPCLSVPII